MSNSYLIELGVTEAEHDEAQEAFNQEACQQDEANQHFDEIQAQVRDCEPSDFQ